MIYVNLLILIIFEWKYIVFILFYLYVSWCDDKLCKKNGVFNFINLLIYLIIMVKLKVKKMNI